MKSIAFELGYKHEKDFKLSRKQNKGQGWWCTLGGIQITCNMGNVMNHVWKKTRKVLHGKQYTRQNRTGNSIACVALLSYRVCGLTQFKHAFQKVLWKYITNSNMIIDLTMENLTIFSLDCNKRSSNCHQYIILKRILKTLRKK